MKIKIYAFCVQDRSGRVRWTLEELGLSHESAFLDYEKNEHKSAAFLQISPTGRVPAIEIDGHSMHESAAICMALADRHEDRGLIPPRGSRERDLYFQWCLYAAATLEPAYA